MRCHICDYDSTHHQTAYSTSVCHKQSYSSITVRIDPRTAKPTCSDCEQTIKRAVRGTTIPHKRFWSEMK